MPRWLGEGELRLGLGCMRLPPDSAEETIATALSVGITVFDTAHAYGDASGDNERLLSRALRGTTARVVTKGGMTRAGGGWMPDGRASSIRRDCEESLAALDGVPIDLYLLHAPDPHVPWLTSVRALAALLDEGLVPRVGVSNVNRDQLDAALSVVPVTAVEVALNPYDDSAVRGGVVGRCEQNGITVLAHSPLGGPRRVRRDEAEQALAWVLAQSPVVVPIPGARSPSSVRSAVRALDLQVRTAAPVEAARRTGEVKLVMGIPGAGKSRLTATLVGYERLNRDERGGSLNQIADELDKVLAAGGERVVLDNTYVTRAARNRVVEIAERHGVAVTCVWLDTSLADAQTNLVLRQLDLFDRLPDPAELRLLAKRHPGLMLPGSQMRTLRELEPPTSDEGFVEIVRVPFERAAGTGRAGVLIAADAVARLPATDIDLPHLVFAWQTGPDPVPSFVTDVAICPHPGGPPACWCRPPLPGLVLELCRRHRVDPMQSVLFGTTTTHRRMAAAIGARFQQV